MDEAALLEEIDTYLDAVPRTAARAEALGTLTLFVREGSGWPYYARPARGREAPITVRAVEDVRARQRTLGIPETFEWVQDLSPDLGEAAAETGLEVSMHPLLWRASAYRVEVPEGFSVGFASPDEVGPLVALAEVGFGRPGTGSGPEGEEAVSRRLAGLDPGRVGSTAERIVAGHTVMAALRDERGVAVAVGCHQPLHGVSEIVGVATLPKFRRLGLGAAITAVLAEDAGSRGCGTVFLSAGDGDVARVYERVGFRRVGTAGAAEPPSRALEAST